MALVCSDSVRGWTKNYRFKYKLKYKSIKSPYFVVCYTSKSVSWNDSPLAVRANPQFGMYLILWNEFTAQNVAHYEVVIHGVGNDLGDRGGVKLNESVML